MPTTALDAIDRATRRVVAERRRASRSAEIASRHDELATVGPTTLRQFHEAAAIANHQMQARHLVSAGIQASHLARLRARVQAVMLGPSPDQATPTRRNRSVFRAGSMGIHDPLTDLPNRLMFAERLAVAIEPDDPEQPIDLGYHVGVCLIGLDKFQAVNDRYGREVGDRVLVALARRLTDRTPRRFLARLGSDKFVVLLEGTSGLDEATVLAEGLLAAVSEPLRVDGHELTVSASIGVVECSAEHADPAEIVRAAEISLDWAKSDGRGRWAVFDRRRHDEATARDALAAALPSAIDRGELRLDYQPIVSLDDGVLVGAEALVRWHHPELGVLSPDQFLDLAEEGGSILRLGHAVLTQACGEAARWMHLTSIQPFVSVNVTPRQLHDSDLVREVATVLAETGLPASQLRLEITEGALVRPDGRSVSVLHSLVDLGVSIVIDDFGTGYSNLAYLGRLPVRMIKIDRSFVTDLCLLDGSADPINAEILAAIVSLAHALGLTVTAEGVETAAQAEWLQSIGCDFAQGWHFARAIGPAEIEAAIVSNG